ncbi:hypothetical protein JKP75_14300 [Blastococcus sp. TML/M2B]|uniref:hypothetical protein n=1 Tax=unclassified Blastococcus TaxID=2619396 RepID=UPI00190C44E3|nr:MULTISPECIES: hypothetical protein [unclassified Blastococcus]MBN1093622.1 hypothetical protein [Blastococcus sp. TML/M2B]MBN1096259.1 hypothetical protein [Blastococcus sp. TML/C7B]
MHPELARALEPVLHDLRAGGPQPHRIGDQDPADEEGVASAWLWSADGSGTGVSVVLGAPLPEQLAHVADQVHDWAVEELWGTARTSWPPCPEHPDSHPLVVRRAGDDVTWACPRSGTTVCRVGELR